MVANTGTTGSDNSVHNRTLVVDVRVSDGRLRCRRHVFCRREILHRGYFAVELWMRGWRANVLIKTYTSMVRAGKLFAELRWRDGDRRWAHTRKRSGLERADLWARDVRTFRLRGDKLSCRVRSLCSSSCNAICDEGVFLRAGAAISSSNQWWLTVLQRFSFTYERSCVSATNNLITQNHK